MRVSKLFTGDWWLPVAVIGGTLVLMVGCAFLALYVSHKTLTVIFCFMMGVVFGPSVYRLALKKDAWLRRRLRRGGKT
ncbi:MAG: hypothetical protein Q7S96_01080 [bacterium]|nr:hypothetical protein [bacterium]